MFGSIGRAVTTRPLTVIVGWLAAAAAVIVFSPRIADVTNADQAAFLPATSESAQAEAIAARAFPEARGATAVIVVKRTDGAALGEADFGAVGGLVQRLNANRPESVRGIAFGRADEPGTVDPRSVAPDRTLALVSVGFTAPAEDERVRQAVLDLRRDTQAALANSGLSAGMTGQAAVVADNRQAIADAEKIVTWVTLALILVLLLVIFRSPVAAALPLLAVGLVYAVTTSLVAVAATVFGFDVGQEVPTMLTVVLFGIGTDYVLFLLFRLRERLRAGDDPRAAIVAAVERVGEAISSAAAAVMAAFGALVLAALGFFTTLGPALAIGAAVTMLAALTLVPAVVALLGRFVFWPSTVGRQRSRRGGFAALGRLVARRPALVVVASLVLLGGPAAGTLVFRPTYDPIAQLPGQTEARTAFEDLKRGFPAGALAPTEVYLAVTRPLAPADMRAFVGRLAAVDGVASPLEPRFSTDGRVVAVSVLLAVEPYSAAALDLVAGPLRDAALAAAPAGAHVYVGGQSMAFADVRATTERDLAVVFPVAGVLFLLILAGLLRAVLTPIYLVAMVVAGFAATLGASALVFDEGLGRAGLAFTIPIILYLFVTAIGTDYNILVTARLREEVRDGRSVRDAAGLAVAHAGPAVAAAALILAGTFGSLLLTGVPFFVEIGFAVTLGILVVAFLIALLLVPATTALLGRVALWPGTPSPSGTDAGPLQVETVEQGEQQEEATPAARPRRP
jgi:putative drug exporter of the RND superfamily